MNDYFDTDYMLLIQSDSWVCNENNIVLSFLISMIIWEVDGTSKMVMVVLVVQREQMVT